MIKKAVIPAAGFGTRFLPITKSVPKEMLPIIDRPAIHYIVLEAITAGIDDIIIITGRGKRAIEDYFDASPEMENFLRKNNRSDLLKEINDISSLVDIHYIRQKDPLGLGDAVLKAEKHIGNQAFAVLLGDDIISNDKAPAIKQLIDYHEHVGCSVLGVEEVIPEMVNRYGIIKYKKQDELLLVQDLVEKPQKEEAPSNLAILGRYILTPEIFDCIRKVKPDKRGEIQLTDALKYLLEIQQMFAVEIDGERYDVGETFGYIKTIIDFSLSRKELKDGVRDYMRQRLNE
jgi:UTP--glucose-1-phosphate uridylyltransferase